LHEVEVNKFRSKFGGFGGDVIDSMQNAFFDGLLPLGLVVGSNMILVPVAEVHGKQTKLVFR